MPPSDQPPRKRKGPPRKGAQSQGGKFQDGKPRGKKNEGGKSQRGNFRRSKPSSGKSGPGSRGRRRFSEASNWKPALLTLKKIGEGKFAFEAPPCAIDRDLDLEEVHNMIAGAELEIARDELLYLVADCRGFLEAYCILAELALEEGDIPLAKGHYGFAYENGIEALPKGFKGKLPAAEGYNSHFYKAGRGLARCLIAKNELEKGREVLEQLRKFDPTEPETTDLLKQLDEREANRNA
ncbi:MAG: tetratricopeptide repeat protein [Planctomycetaceae bacterium]|nr:tetratricopeptide repeat protein [Planctomycetaceae bacterium]